MKKIPCVFARDFSNPKAPKILNEVTPGCEWVLNGEGVATIKYDGTACSVNGGRLYRRFDAKKGKEPPYGFEPAQVPDPITGHWPGWVPIDVDNPDPADVWHALAWFQYIDRNHERLNDGTYELCGPRINSNHENMGSYFFIGHGRTAAFGAGYPRDFESLRTFLLDLDNEGIVFWREQGNVNSDMAKLTRENFGFPWPITEKKGQ